MATIPLDRAERIARHVKDLLEPACQQITVAGSVRRRKPDVGDIELVAEPILKPEPNLFGGGRDVSELDRVLARLCADPLSHLTRGRADGDRMKVLLWRDAIQIDLFVVRKPAQFGAILALRTGPAKFSELLVTPRRKQGALPDHLVHRQGGLYVLRTRELLVTPTEADWFEAIGVPHWSPEERFEARLRRHIGQLVH